MDDMNIKRKDAHQDSFHGPHGTKDHYSPDHPFSPHHAKEGDKKIQIHKLHHSGYMYSRADNDYTRSNLILVRSRKLEELGMGMLVGVGVAEVDMDSVPGQERGRVGRGCNSFECGMYCKLLLYDGIEDSSVVLALFQTKKWRLLSLG
jgi:hypothetical protein